MSQPLPEIVTVTLNTAIDRVIEVPHFVLGAHAKGQLLSRYPAGKGVNVCRGLASLGVDSVACGFVGRGQLRLFQQALAAAKPGRVIEQFLTVAEDTRENITLIDPPSGMDTHIRDAGFTVNKDDLERIGRKLGLLARSAKVISFSGSLPQGMEAAHLVAFIKQISHGSCRVVLDLEGDLLIEVIEQCPSAIWMIKPNRSELIDAAGLPPTADDASVLVAAQKLAKKVQWVALTLGDQGAWLVSNKERFHAAIATFNKPSIVNTVGCGDCFMAGLFAAGIDEFNPEKSLPLAVASALANAQKAGIAEFDHQTIETMAQSVVVKSY